MKRFLLASLMLAVSVMAFAQVKMVPHVTPVGRDFDTNFFLVNPTTQTQTYTLTPFQADGTPLPIVEGSLEAGETAYFSTPDLFPSGSVSHFKLAEQDQIEITVAYQVATGGNSSAHLSAGFSESPRWRIFPGELDDVLDGIAFVNLHSEPQDIWVRQLLANGDEVQRVMINTLDPNSKGLYLFGDFAKIDGSSFEVFSQGSLAITALRFSNVGANARFFWETSALPLPALVEAPTNEAPVISGQNALSVDAGGSLEITLDDLIVEDTDNAFPGDFTLTVMDGANYSRNGATVTPADGFTGELMVPVIVNDGSDNSNTYNLLVTVNQAQDPRIGTVAVFPVNRTYGVSGRAVIVDERTVRLENFNYNGRGPDVRVYLGKGGNYVNGIIISDSINDTVYTDATLTYTLPDNVTLDDFDGISIWCTLFSIDFSSAFFQ